ncbi:helix-turn-helix domain-containing protein [Bdellovibrio bacteriovorus]|uniref:helix-turn-helix domain-containing protein n=1 Tax=Bdellovibrio bacteriovorus TaxID=959 RepID=UPI000AABB6D8|nr:helix-turn-helix transcriptional regulator [Bdellovibrio bacteriovorus]
MATESFSLCHDTLNSLFREKGLSQIAVAEKLHISTKTVQRWSNRTARRIRAELLTDLAAFLEVPAEQLIKNTESFKMRPHDPLLEELLHDSYLQMIRATDNWDGYLRMLRSFQNEDLPSSQALGLFLNMGIATLHVGQMRASRFYLQKGHDLAVTLNDSKALARSHIWSAFREEQAGNLSIALLHLEKAQSFLKSTSSYSLEADLHFCYGRIHAHLRNFHVARTAFRKSLLISVTQKLTTRAAVTYTELAYLQFKFGFYKHATLSFQRALKNAQISGWAHGISVARVGLNLIHSIKAKTRFPQLTKNLMVANTKVDGRLEDLLFQGALLNGDIESANKIVLARIKKSRATPLHFAYAILDAHILSAKNPQNYVLRESLLAKARDTLKRNGIPAV